MTGATVSAAFMAFSPAATTRRRRGCPTLGLVSAGVIPTFHVPIWVIALSAVAMAAERLRADDGSSIRWARVRAPGPIHGFAAETSAALVIRPRLAWVFAQHDACDQLGILAWVPHGG
jgi:PiT family inorganic phosphate transporter